MFDDWGVCRTRCNGDDRLLPGGLRRRVLAARVLRPQIVFESLGDYADTAYRLGEEFARKYPDRSQRAEEIFYFVRDNVRYQLDEDQFDLDEFAQNADELAGTVEDEGVAFGDCEDMAILLVTMLYGGGLRSAIVDCPGHAGAVVHLPGYEEANVVLTFEGESGWAWAEATGKNNPFGWFPEGQLDGPFLAYEISADSIGLARATNIAATPSDFGFTVVLGGDNPAAQSLALKNSGRERCSGPSATMQPAVSASPIERHLQRGDGRRHPLGRCRRAGRRQLRGGRYHLLRRRGQQPGGDTRLARRDHHHRRDGGYRPQLVGLQLQGSPWAGGSPASQVLVA